MKRIRRIGRSNQGSNPGAHPSDVVVQRIHGGSADSKTFNSAIAVCKSTREVLRECREKNLVEYSKLRLGVLSRNNESAMRLLLTPKLNHRRCIEAATLAVETWHSVMTKLKFSDLLLYRHMVIDDSAETDPAIRWLSDKIPVRTGGFRGQLSRYHARLRNI
jgi:hypothetical protein